MRTIRRNNRHVFFRGPQRKLEKLLSEAKKALTRGDRFVAIKQFKEAGDVATEMGEFERAIDAYCNAEAFDVAAELAEFNGNWSHASELWLRAGRFAAAGRAQQKAGAPQEAVALLERGGAKKEAAEIHESLGNFFKAGSLFESTGDLERAASSYVQAATTRSDPDVWMRAAQLLIKTEQLADGLQILEQTGQLHRAGQMLRAAGQWELAEQYFVKAGLLMDAADSARRRGHSTRANQLEAQAASKREDWPRAAAFFEEAGFLEEAIDCYRRAGKPLRAAQLCERLRDFLRAASYYRMAKRPVDAERCDRKVDDPQDRTAPVTPRSISRSTPRLLEELFSAVDTLRALAQQGDRGRYAEAMDLLRSVSPELPVYGRARKLLSELLEEQGDDTGAVEVLLECLRLPKLTRHHLPALLRYGWLLERSGLLAEAIEIYQRARNLDPEYPELEARIQMLQTRQLSESAPDWPAELAGDLLT